MGSLLGAHRTLMRQIATGPVHVAAPEDVPSAAAGLSPPVYPPPAVPLPQAAADGHRKRKRRKVHGAGDGASSVPKH